MIADAPVALGPEANTAPLANMTADQTLEWLLAQLHKEAPCYPSVPDLHRLLEQIAEVEIPRETIDGWTLEQCGEVLEWLGRRQAGTETGWPPICVLKAQGHPERARQPMPRHADPKARQKAKNARTATNGSGKVDHRSGRRSTQGRAQGATAGAKRR